MLFVATHWVATVYAVSHPTSDPPGPRFKGRDATVLGKYQDRNSRKRAATETQNKLFAGHTRIR